MDTMPQSADSDVQLLLLNAKSRQVLTARVAELFSSRIARELCLPADRRRTEDARAGRHDRWRTATIHQEVARTARCVVRICIGRGHWTLAVQFGVRSVRDVAAVGMIFCQVIANRTVPAQRSPLASQAQFSADAAAVAAAAVIAAETARLANASIAAGPQAPRLHHAAVAEQSTTAGSPAVTEQPSVAPAMTEQTAVTTAMTQQAAVTTGAATGIAIAATAARRALTTHRLIPQGHRRQAAAHASTEQAGAARTIGARRGRSTIGRRGLLDRSRRVCDIAAEPPTEQAAAESSATIAGSAPATIVGRSLAAVVRRRRVLAIAATRGIAAPGIAAGSAAT